MASLSNDQPKIAWPTTRLSAERPSMLKMLRNTPRSSFDHLYITQSAQVQQGTWANFKGHAADGAAHPTKQHAGTGVTTIEPQLPQAGALIHSAPTPN